MDCPISATERIELTEMTASSHDLSLEDQQPNFYDLDDPTNLDELMRTVQNSATRNFVLDFSDAAAHVSFDLSTSSFTNLLRTGTPEACCRWINVWYPYYQRPILELLAKHYDFTPRLLALMSSDPYRSKQSLVHHESDRVSSRSFWSRHKSRSSAESDMEKGVDELSEHSSISSYDSTARDNLYRIVDDIWHYTSVDFGRTYVSIGYNSLYGTKSSGDTSGDGLLPFCARVWTWLVLCEDSTVISINEDPFPATHGTFNALQLRILRETRRNLVNVFRSLSKVDDGTLMARKPMNLLPIRLRLGDTPEETAHRVSDAPGLLLYYLFENWQNSYTLIARKESRYGVELSNLRAQMFKQPTLAHIDRLDRIGKELGVLKRHYLGYKRIIDRMIDNPVVTPLSLENSNVAADASHTSFETIRPMATARQSVLGVSLSSAARARFKRLRDLIDLYALSEVNEYVKQKDSLITMNFHLIAMRESLDMERLTRVTLLITKATILFLPVSLMTSYFSTQLTHVEYTVTQYWVSFAVILFLSWIALFIFGVFSGSVETITFFKDLQRGFQTIGRMLRHR